MSIKKSFILANLTWNSHGWQEPSQDKSGFKWVAKDPLKNIPEESWNFEDSHGKIQRGFFENIGRNVSHFQNGGVVFFLSRNISENKKLLVGFYANARVFRPKTNSKRNGHQYSIEAPKTSCMKLPEYLVFNSRRHIPKDKTFTRYFVYLTDVEARNIFGDMLRHLQNLYPSGHKTFKQLETIAKSYFPDIKASKQSLHTHEKAINQNDMKKYERKEFDELIDPQIIKIKKDNAKLRESFVNHEKTRNIVAEYFENQKYSVVKDKHIDLLAENGKESIIVEVKSCRDNNMELQVRLGIAQLLYYSYLYKNIKRMRNRKITCCLALQYEPPDKLLHYVVDHCGFDLISISGGRVVYTKGTKKRRK